MYIQCMISLNQNSTFQILFYVWMRYSKFWKSVSHPKLEKSSLQISLTWGGVTIWKFNFEVHFKGLHFAQVINPCKKKLIS